MKRTTAVAFGALALVPLCAGQQATDKKAEKTVPGQALRVPGTEGVVVVKDADTGKPRQATPAEMGAVRHDANRSFAVEAAAPPRKATVNGNGSRMVVLGEESMNFAVATRTADGKLTTREVAGEKKANALVESATPKAAPEVEVK